MQILYLYVINLPFFLFILIQHVDAIDYLLRSYPNYVNVDDLPCETIDDKVDNVFVFILGNGLKIECSWQLCQIVIPCIFFKQMLVSVIFQEDFKMS